MHAFDLLRKDHLKVEQLFERLVGTSDRNTVMREECFVQLRQALLEHADVEEALLYPRLKGDDSVADLLGKALDDHEMVRRMLADLEDLHPDSPVWDQMVGELRMAVQDHVRIEEDTILPQIAQRMTAGELAKLGEEMDAIRDGVIGQPELGEVPVSGRAPRPEKGERDY